MPSLRQDIVESSDWLHRIRGYIPGFSGYDTKEGFSDSDRMLRMTIIQKVALARKEIETARSSAAQGNLGDIGQMEPVENGLKRVATALSYSDSGYGWMSWDQDEAEECRDRLCESDAHLIEDVTDLLRLTGNLHKSIASRDVASSKRILGEMSTKTSFLEDAIRLRESLIRKIRC